MSGALWDQRQVPGAAADARGHGGLPERVVPRRARTLWPPTTGSV